MFARSFPKPKIERMNYVHESKDSRSTPRWYLALRGLCAFPLCGLCVTLSPQVLSASRIRTRNAEPTFRNVLKSDTYTRVPRIRLFPTRAKSTNPGSFGFPATFPVLLSLISRDLQQFPGPLNIFYELQITDYHLLPHIIILAPHPPSISFQFASIPLKEEM